MGFWLGLAMKSMYPRAHLTLYDKAAHDLQELNTTHGLRRFFREVLTSTTQDGMRIFRDGVLKNKYTRKLVSLLLHSDLPQPSEVELIRAAFNSFNGRWSRTYVPGPRQPQKMLSEVNVCQA